jgi:CBS domain-containing protein
MFDRTVRSVMRRRGLLKVARDILVSNAAKLMASSNVGAVMVVDGESLVGIFTERDVVFRVVAPGRDPNETRIGDVMTTGPRTIGPEEPFGLALLIMHEGGFRHLPVIEDGKPIGIVSARSAMDPELEEFVSEAQRRQHYTRKRGS